MQCDLKLYKSLGHLIKDYRQWRELNQEAFAKSIGISVRELQRWETDRRCARIENLHDLSEITGIPMQVCVALNTDQPVWYSLRKRRFAYSSIEEAQFIKFVTDELYNCPQSDEGVLIKNDPIITDKHISTILSCHRDLYGPAIPLREDIMKAASRLLPDLNRIAFDCWGHYVGHQVCLPIKTDLYQHLKKQKVFECNLTSEAMCDIVALHEGVFYLYSIFVASTSIARSIIINSQRFLATIEPKERYLVARIAITADGMKISDNFGMKRVFSNKSDHEHKVTDVAPTMYEIKLDVLMKHIRNLSALVGMIEGDERKADPGDINGWAEQKEESTILFQTPSHFNRLRKKYVTEKGLRDSLLNIDSPLRVDKRKQVSIRGKPQMYKLKMEACPNPKCALYGKMEKSNIVSNGTYRTKEGILSRRYLCKECGESFCSRTGSIFYGLRSPEEKILKALNLLVKGMSLGDVAKALEVKFDTVRRWIKFAAEQRGKIDDLLMKKMSVSKVDLESLWTSVKKSSFRQRASL